MYKIGFLGMGKMGSAILQGILKDGLYQAKDICFYTPTAKTSEKYKDLNIYLTKDEEDLLLNSNIIILAIKPQIYDSITAISKNYDFLNKIIVSLAPGKTIQYLKDHFKNALVLRAMPNTSAAILKSVTTICFDGKENEEVLKIFSSIGSYLLVEEAKIDELIPLNGSMPAYILEFVKDFIEASKKYGIDEKDAKKIVLETIIASCMMALNSKDDLDTLINNVCSKGGSTIKGLDELRNNDLKLIISKCYDACVQRSKELKDV